MKMTMENMRVNFIFVLALLCLELFPADTSVQAEDQSRDFIIERVHRKNRVEEQKRIERKAREERLEEAFAEDDGSSEGKSQDNRRELQRRKDMLLKLYDANGDGMLDKQENSLLNDDLCSVFGKKDAWNSKKQKEKDR